jgi:probable F420-dependent oxidoreductase
MNIGIFQVIADSARDPAPIARRVEELGFHSYWLGEHTIVPEMIDDRYPRNEPLEELPVYLPHLVDPLMGLARAAAVTERIKLGTAVSLPAERNPLLFAKQVATLDDHSRGRVILGIGGGWSRQQCAILGGDPDHRWAHVKDHVHAMKALWTQDVSTYEGRYISFPPVRCFPKPVQKPHPPIVIGGPGTPATLRRVATWGDGWMPHSMPSLDQFADDIATVRALATEAGRDPDAIEFAVTGIEEEYRTVESIEPLVAAGAQRVNIWLREDRLDGILAELDELAHLPRAFSGAGATPSH